MKGLGLVALTVLIGIVTGCLPEQSNLATAPTPVPVARSQKPEAAEQPLNPTSFLDRTPEKPLERGDGQTVAAIRAVVNGVPILESEVRSTCYQPLQQTSGLAEPERSRRQREIIDKTLDSLIERELIVQDAYSKLKNSGKFLDKLKEGAAKEFDRTIARKLKKEYNLKTEEEFKSMLRSQGVTLDGMKKQYERQFIYQQYLQSRVQPALDRIGHTQILEYYNTHPEEFKQADQVQWQDIFIATAKHPNPEVARRHAEHVLNRARLGDDFAKLAVQFDNGFASYNNGEGIGKKRGEIQPREVEAVLFSLKDGEIGPIVELPTGYHIVKVVQRDYAGQMLFDDKTQALIRDKLKNEVFNRESKRIVTDLKRKATIDIATTP